MILGTWTLTPEYPYPYGGLGAIRGTGQGSQGFGGLTTGQQVTTGSNERKSDIYQ
jgi:hypothetical protein